MKDLSVIVPVHNTEKWLPDLLKSLKEQETTYDVQYIFIFDSCDDNSKWIVEQSNISDILFSCEYGSCGLARNKGLELAQGKYIWFMDSDDYLTSNTAIQEAMDFIIEKNEKIVKIPFESDKFNNSCYAMVWQYVFEREFIGNTRFRAEQPAEDNDFMDKIFKKINPTKIETYYYPLYFYRYLREGSNMFRVKNGEDINKENKDD